jgi:hypothetical protein
MPSLGVEFEIVGCGCVGLLGKATGSSSQGLDGWASGCCTGASDRNLVPLTSELALRIVPAEWCCLIVCGY